MQAPPDRAAQAAAYRSERLEEHGVVKEVFLLHMLVNWLADDQRFCDGVDHWLASWDAEDHAKAAAMEAEMAQPPCGTCGGVAPGHSLVCPHYPAMAGATT